ncbi:MAG: hypothetical protein AAGJ38_00870 [Planctomycetota bacterium]
MTQRERRTVTIGLGVIVLAVLLNFGFGPVFASWQDARDMARDHRDRMSSLETMLDRRDVKQSQLELRFGKGVGRDLPTVSEARVAFPEVVQKTLGASGMELSTVSLQGVRAVREVAGVSMVSLRVDGTVAGAQLPDTLAALRGGELLTLVEEVRMDKGRDRGRGDGPSYELTLVLATPVLTEARP